jgi:RNA polymerase sigma-70 factor (ECF subfamily)
VADDARAENGRIDPATLSATVRRAQSGDVIAVDALLDIVTPYVRRLCGPIAYTPICLVLCAAATLVAVRQ